MADTSVNVTAAAAAEAADSSSVAPQEGIEGISVAVSGLLIMCFLRSRMFTKLSLDEPFRPIFILSSNSTGARPPIELPRDQVWLASSPTV